MHLSEGMWKTLCARPRHTLHQQKIRHMHALLVLRLFSCLFNLSSGFLIHHQNELAHVSCTPSRSGNVAWSLAMSHGWNEPGCCRQVGKHENGRTVPLQLSPCQASPSELRKEETCTRRSNELEERGRRGKLRVEMLEGEGVGSQMFEKMMVKKFLKIQDLSYVDR